MQPAIQKSPKPSRIRRGCFFLLLPVLFLPVVLLLAVPIYNWQAKRAFEKHVEELSKIGESIRIEDLRPEPLTDLENSFVGHPLIARLIEESRTRDGRGFDPDLTMDRLSLAAVPNSIRSNFNRRAIRYFGGRSLPEFDPPLAESEAIRRILEYCESKSSDLDAFAEATRRSVASLDLPYDEGFGMKTPFVDPLENLGPLIAARAKCNVILHNGGKAKEDVQTLICLSNQLGEEPSIIAQLLCIHFYDIAIGVVHDGVSRNVWDGPTLHSLSALLKGARFEAGFLRALRMERAAFLEMMQLLRDDPEKVVNRFSLRTQPGPNYPAIFTLVSGLTYDNARLYSETLQRNVLTTEDGQLEMERLRTDGALKDAWMTVNRNVATKMRYVFAASSIPTYDGLSHRFLRTTVYRDHARIALELESHRITSGTYPPSLSDLPKTGIPLNLTDPITNEPYHYRLFPDGRYHLYSVGLNRIDEEGLLKRDLDAGDWVWRLTIPEDFDPDAYAK